MHAIDICGIIVVTLSRQREQGQVVRSGVTVLMSTADSIRHPACSPVLIIGLKGSVMDRKKARSESFLERWSRLNASSWSLYGK